MNGELRNTQALAEAAQLFQTGQFAEAKTACALHLTLQPDDHRACQIMALIEHQLGNQISAIDHIRRATALAPNEAAYHANHGAILHAHGDIEGALSAYQNARAADRTFSDIDKAIGILLDALDRPTEAVESYRRALEFTPQDVSLHLNLGAACRKAGDYKSAADSFRKAITLQPETADGHYDLAVVLQDAGDHALARASLNNAIHLSPDVTVYHLALGKTELALGNNAAADAVFRKVMLLDPNGSNFNLDGTTADIETALERGNIARADQLCRLAMAEFPPCPRWPFYRSRIAAHLNLHDQAQHWLTVTKQSIANAAPALFPALEARLPELQSKPAERPGNLHPSPSYLLIKCWGYGFWSDVSHVLASLLLAEMTGRIPVIHWGSNSCYTDAPELNSFTTFYQPANDVSLEELAELDSDYFPDKWHAGNLDQDGLNYWVGPGSRQSGLYFLNRPEKIVVSDFYTQISELLPWLDAEHPLHGCSVREAYYQLYRKYFKLQPTVQREVDAFIETNFTGHPSLGIHIRNVDKGYENPRFQEELAQIPPIVKAYIKKYPDLRIFLLTDSVEALETWRREYGERVFNSDCTRTSSQFALTWDDVDSRYRLGVEIIKDTYAAAACDFFVGLGCTNVPAMVVNLKRWQDEDLHIIGDIVMMKDNWSLHDW